MHRWPASEQARSMGKAQIKTRIHLKPVLLKGHLHGTKEGQGCKRNWVHPSMGLSEKTSPHHLQAGASIPLPQTVGLQQTIG